MEEVILDVDLNLIENTLSDIAVLLTTFLDKLDFFEKSLIQLNGYFYILLFCLAGVGFFLLLYKFLKIFI